jgi:hypothetical protein
MSALSELRACVGPTLSVNQSLAAIETWIRRWVETAEACYSIDNMCWSTMSKAQQDRLLEVVHRDLASKIGLELLVPGRARVIPDRDVNMDARREYVVAKVIRAEPRS